jgi:hypothetical protein
MLKDEAPEPGRLSRREFVDRAGRAALLVSMGAAVEWPRAAAAAAPVRRALFTPRQSILLRQLADVIIPAADGMPSSGEAGAASYLEALALREADVARDLRGAMAAAERQARAAHGRAVDRLDAQERVGVLTAMERDAPDRFRTLRDLVYEGYYTQPRVWAVLGYTFVGQGAEGPPLEPFEEPLLERVRALPQLYREVP